MREAHPPSPAEQHTELDLTELLLFAGSLSTAKYPPQDIARATYDQGEKQR